MSRQVADAVRSDPNHGTFKEVVGTQRDHGDAVLARQRPHVGDARIGRQRIDVRALHVVDPFDGIHSCLRCERELLAPAIAREALDRLSAW